MDSSIKFPLAGLILEFWRASDRAKTLRSTEPEAYPYRLATHATIRAAKQVNHEALTRLLRKDYPIPYPWEGDGGLEP